MESSQYRNRKNRATGFTIFETMIALMLLVVGVLSVALLISRMQGGTERSRYMNTAATLASEKLEDLSRYPVNDSHVAVLSTNTSEGSLTDTEPSETGFTPTVYYFDDVWISSGSGKVEEVKTSRDSKTGSLCYLQFIHSADGVASEQTCTSTEPTMPSGTLKFHRQWLIESPVVIGSTTVAGTRRITVLVTLANGSEANKVKFQMSMVRP